jgi:hypothetical protein
MIVASSPRVYEIPPAKGFGGFVDAIVIEAFGHGSVAVKVNCTVYCLSPTVTVISKVYTPGGKFLMSLDWNDQSPVSGLKSP